MKTYISLSGFDTSQILSLIVKYGIEGNDRMVLIRPIDERDKRGETTTQAVRDLSRQIDSTIKVEIYRVDHQDFEGMVLSLISLIKNTEGEIIANISGGPREIFLAFAIACLSQSQKIYKTTNYSDIDRAMTEIALPRIVHKIDEKSNTILKDVHENQPTTITAIAKRLNLSESTVSRHIGRLVDIRSVDIVQKGKTKEVRLSFTGNIFLMISRSDENHHDNRRSDICK